MTASLTFATLLGGAILGYGARLYEFKRTQRRDAYVHLASAFLSATRSGSALFSASVQLGDRIRHKEYALQLAPRWDEWRVASQEFDVAFAAVTLIGSMAARREAEDLDQFLAENVRAVPPFVQMEEGTDGWGDAATVGPAEVAAVATERVREFAEALRPEIVGWRLPK